MRRYKNWAHKIGSQKYLTLWRPVLPVFPEHREPHFSSPPWALFRGGWRSAAAIAPDLVLVEVDGKCQFVAGITQVMKSLCSSSTSVKMMTQRGGRDRTTADPFLSVLAYSAVRPRTVWGECQGLKWNRLSFVQCPHCSVKDTATEAHTKYKITKCAISVIPHVCSYICI